MSKGKRKIVIITIASVVLLTALVVILRATVYGPSDIDPCSGKNNGGNVPMVDCGTPANQNS